MVDKESINESFLVGYSGNEDEGVLIIAKKEPNETFDIINAFNGKEAYDLYMRLRTQKEKGDE